MCYRYQRFARPFEADCEGRGGLRGMLFKRRNKPTFAQAVRAAVWPRTSFSRSARYVWKRLFRLNASPHRIALGCAAGVFASITPLIGVQMIMAGAIALVLRGSLTAAMLATFAGNPLTWPLIWASTYGLGAMIVGSPAEAAAMPVGPDRLGPVVYTMLIGSIPLGLLAAVGTYSATLRGVEAVRSGSAGLALSLPELGGAASFEWLRAQYRAMTEPAWRLW